MPASPSPIGGDSLPAIVVRNCLIPLIIAVALSVAIYSQSNMVAQMHFHNIETFFHYELETVPRDDLIQAWKPRVFSALLAKSSQNLMTPYVNIPTGTLPRSPESHAIAQWTALWFLAICAVYVIAFRRWATLYIFGTYAGLAFGYMPGLVDRIFPWDMPALFFFVLFVGAFHLRCNAYILIALIWLGIPFKETVGLLSLFPILLGNGGIRRRIGMTLLAVGGCVIVKVAIDILTHNSDVGLTMSHLPLEGDEPLLTSNLREFKGGLPFLVNGGTLLSFLIRPGRSRTLLGMKAIAAVFIVGNLIFGVITELRIWFEMIPIALYGVCFENVADRRQED